MKNNNIFLLTGPWEDSRLGGGGRHNPGGKCWVPGSVCFPGQTREWQDGGVKTSEEGLLTEDSMYRDL